MADEISISRDKKFRKLAVLLDGTWNDTGDNTNVWRMKSLCRSDPDSRQILYYDKGVNGLWGGSFGKGLIENVVQAYEWLVENYEPGDLIFIFGFSRGAYTARSLAGFVAKQGLLMRGVPLGVGQLYARYKRPGCDSIYKLNERMRLSPTSEFSLEERWTAKYSREVDIAMIGVWDTVGAHGLPIFTIPGISSSTLGFLHTGLRQSIKSAYHAVAIDEHRKKFAPTLWTKLSTTLAQPRPIESVEQRWFVGAHANVGGGYSSDPLSQPSLRWMLSRAQRNGLIFSPQSEPDSLASTAIADSYASFLCGTYRLMHPRFCRAIDAGPLPTGKPGETEIPINESIDSSVFERYRADDSYRPPSLMQWAKRHGVDMKNIKSSVLASEPKKIVDE